MDFIYGNNGRGPLPPTVERALRVVGELLRKAGPGFHHLACEADVPGGDPLFKCAHAYIEGEDDDPDVGAPVKEMADFTEVLAWGLAIRSGLLLLETESDSGTRIQGWVIGGNGLTPLTRSQLLDAFADSPQERGEMDEFTTAFPIHSQGV
ncbi:hypothetical protein [Streptomyces sp. OE57]|uniref:hypothetical protein n=1 Tax=Streptomyces lacaronensis TaxID=3379885 RepID=UPI0039B76565